MHVCKKSGLVVKGDEVRGEVEVVLVGSGDLVWFTELEHLELGR